MAVPPPQASSAPVPKRPIFPFTAIVGMDDLRLALVLGAIDPSIGGVLVRGEKGTAKSTAVRALEQVLPPTKTGPGRVVELPIGATEDRLVGSLDVERALTEGVKAFEPGLLASAHHGVLYVDEVNLLHDHLVDLLLDAAAMGTVYVERDGLSLSYPSTFHLVGTMNPEEGELRPQLLDRFGMTVQVAAPRDPADRVEVVKRRLAFDAAPGAFARQFADSVNDLRGRIGVARDDAGTVELSDAALHQIAHVCAAFEVDGLRADIVMARAAIAHAAWHGRASVVEDDVRVAAKLALPHRRRRNPFDAPGLDEEQLERALAESRQPDPPEPDDPDGTPPDGPEHEESEPTPDPSGEPEPGDESGPSDRTEDTTEACVARDGTRAGPETSQPEAANADTAPPRPETERAAPPSAPGDGSVQIAAPNATFRVKRLEVPGIGAGAAGRRSRAITDHGKVVRALTPQGRPHDIHLLGTLAAAAPHQRQRGHTGPGLRVTRADIRVAQREGREGNLILFVVDASGSMAARKRMSAVKGAVLSLLLDAYQRRDKVGLISFRGEGATLVLPPTSSVEAAAARLATLPTGGRTPLTAGLVKAHDTLRVERIRDPRRRPLLVLVTDGRHTAGGDPSDALRLLAYDGVASVIVDAESGPVRLGLAAGLAAGLGGLCLRLDDLGSGAADGAQALATTIRDLKNAA